MLHERLLAVGNMVVGQCPAGTRRLKGRWGEAVDRADRRLNASNGAPLHNTDPLPCGTSGRGGGGSAPPFPAKCRDVTKTHTNRPHGSTTFRNAPRDVAIASRSPAVPPQVRRTCPRGRARASLGRGGGGRHRGIREVLEDPVDVGLQLVLRHRVLEEDPDQNRGGPLTDALRETWGDVGAAPAAGPPEPVLGHPLHRRLTERGISAGTLEYPRRNAPPPPPPPGW